MASSEVSDPISEMEALLKELVALEETQGQKAIEAESRYSKAVTKYISSLEELRFYQDKLNLAEYNVTRQSLIRRYIDANMKNKDGITNYDLMTDGRPPVNTYNGQDSIELHHIKQEYKGPFAELTATQHDHPGEGINLHPKGKDHESWRSDWEKCHAFDLERAKHWMKRSVMISGQLGEPSGIRWSRRRYHTL